MKMTVSPERFGINSSASRDLCHLCCIYTWANLLKRSAKSGVIRKRLKDFSPFNKKFKKNKTGIDCTYTMVCMIRQTDLYNYIDFLYRIVPYFWFNTDTNFRTCIMKLLLQIISATAPCTTMMKAGLLYWQELLTSCQLTQSQPEHSTLA